MRVVRIGGGFAALVLVTQVLAAQQPSPPQAPDHRRGGMMSASGMAEQMHMMDSLNARLDTLVSRMNRATGSRKVTAMAEVINELIAQRKVMHAHMRQMMESGEGMMHMMGQPTPSEGGPPAPKTDSAKTDSSAADTAGHAGHHPPS
jgi:hypothetical protein